MKIAVAGLGSIGARHLRNLHALGITDLVGCDPDAAARDRAASIAAVVATLEDALATRPDAVCLCTPNHLHADGMARALEAGAHVFVEKPIAHSLDRLDEVLALAERRGRTVLVGCNMRFHAGIAALSRALGDGLLPDACVFRAWFAHYLPNWRPGADYRTSYSAQASQGGGIVLDAVHELDYLRWLAGPVTSISASGAHASALEIDTEDFASIGLRFASGAVGSVTLDYIRPVKSRGCEIYGPSGILCWTSDGRAPERVRVTLTDPAREVRTLLDIAAYDGNQMYLDEMRHFLACIDGREQPKQGAADAIDVLRLALAARARITAPVQGAVLS